MKVALYFIDIISIYNWKGLVIEIFKIINISYFVIYIINNNRR